MTDRPPGIPGYRRFRSREEALGRVLEFICQFKQDHDGNSPTVQQIADGVGLTKSGVPGYLRDLAKAEEIRIYSVGRVMRAIEVVGGRWLAPGADCNVIETQRSHVPAL